jgi:hypothetical protein
MRLKIAMKRAVPLMLAALLLALSACGKDNTANTPSPANVVTERWLTDSDATYSEELPDDEPSVSQSENIIQVGKTADSKDVYALEHFAIAPTFLADEVSEARLFLKLVSGAMPKSLTIAPMLGAWEGYFDARATVDSLVSNGSAITADVTAEADGWVSADITPVVKSWLDGGLQNNGFAVFGTVRGEMNSYASMYDEDNAAYIAVTGAVGDRPLIYGKFGFTLTPLPNAEDMGGNCMSYALRDTNMIFGEDMGTEPAALKSAYDAGGADALADYVAERVLAYVEAHKDGLAISKFRRIDSYDAPIDASSEYRIAMRVGLDKYNEKPDFSGDRDRDFDYHFWLQLNDGRWAQKYPTGDSLIVPCTAANIDPGKFPWSAGYEWTSKDRDYYTSKTVYFAVTKDTDEITRHRGEVRDRNFDENAASTAFSFQSVVAEHLPPFTFDVTETATDGAYTYTISISNDELTDEPYSPQTIDVVSAVKWPVELRDGFISLVDIDFDGFADIQAATSQGNANIVYSYYRWNVFVESGWGEFETTPFFELVTIGHELFPAMWQIINLSHESAATHTEEMWLFLKMSGLAG